MQDQPQQSGMTLQQKMEIAKTIMLLPSLSVIVFLRRRIGYRLLDSGWYLGVALIVYLIAFFSYDPRSRYPNAMHWYAGGIVVMGAIHRAIAWMQLRRGTQPHSYATGISWLGFGFLPSWMRSPGMANCLYDPLLTAVIGVVIYKTFSHAFGYWLLTAAASILFLEILLGKKAADREMDIADGLIAAETQAQAVGRFETTSRQRDGDDGGVVATGLGDDVASKVHLRQRFR